MVGNARALGTMVVAGVFAASGLVGQPSAARADPDAVAAAQKELARIQEESSAIDARYIQLQDQLDHANQALAGATSSLSAQQQKIGTLNANLGAFAMLQYQTSGVDLTTTLLTSDDETDFLNQLATVQSVTARANDRIQSLQEAEAGLAQTRAEAQQTRQQIAADKAEQAQAATQYRQKEAEAQAVLDRLTAQEKARLAELQRQQAEKAAAAARAEQEREAQASAAASAAAEASASASASAAAAPSEGSSATPSSAITPGAASSPAGSPAGSTAASGRAATAIAFAMAQRGKAYVMGATGPNAYDCSGLMLKAWAAAGVQLPRTSQAQFGAGSPVSISDLQPGDLVFYYSGVSHVAMYIGNGQIVHAANPRSGVLVAPVGEMPIVGARRVG